MKRFTSPSKETYLQYHENANRLLMDISNHFNVHISQITFDLIIEFFETKFNILFVYFEADLMYKWLSNKKQEVKYNLTSKNSLSLVDFSFCNVCSGMTIPDFERNRFIVYINQDVVKSRVMFTILHELTHIYFHLMSSVYDKVLVSKTSSNYSDSYPTEIAPLEDEANTIASILFLNDYKLLEYINSGLTFKQLIDLSQMSKPALHNRLMNFLMYNCSCQEYYALSIVQGYKNDEDWAILTLQQFQRELQEIA